MKSFALASRVRLAMAVPIVMMGALGGSTAFQLVAYGKSDSGVKFTSTPGVATLVEHYVVSRGADSGSAKTSDDGRQLPARTPKPAGRDAVVNAAQSRSLSAASSDNNVPEAAQVGTNAGQNSGADNGGTPPPSASFIGQQAGSKTCSYFAKGCNPPDMAVAASPDFVLQGVNTQWEVLDHRGNVLGSPIGAQSFFGVSNVSLADGTPCDVAHLSQPFMSDPRAIYDPSTHRFWAAMLQVEGGLGIAGDCPFKTVYFIAVTQGNDPTGAWNVYEFDMSVGSTNAADFTMIGLNGPAVYFSANMFQANGNYAYAEIFEANKAKMEAGIGGFTADGFINLQGTGPGITAATGPFLADTVQPVIDTGGSSQGNQENRPSGDEFFVNTIDGPDLLNGHLCSSAADACKGLALWRLSNPIGHDTGGGDPTLTGTYIADTKPFVFPPPSDQPSCNACVDASDLRISGTPVLADGTIYAAWETAIDNGTHVVPGIEWAKLSVGEKSTRARTAYYNFSGDAAAVYPALIPDTQGNLVMVFDYMSHTVFPQARYTVRPEGEPQFTHPGVVLKQGEASYRPSLCGQPGGIPVCRWGDYSAASSDGEGGVWFAGQYANSHTSPTDPSVFGRNWGTWIGALIGH